MEPGIEELWCLGAYTKMLKNWLFKNLAAKLRMDGSSRSQFVGVQVLGLESNDFYNLPTILAQFGQTHIWKQLLFMSRSNVEKNVHSVCLTPVSMAMWCIHTLWHFTVPAYTTDSCQKFVCGD